MSLFIRHRAVLVVFTLLVVGCGSTRTTTDAGHGLDPLEYVVDLNDRSDDTFKVTLRVDDLDSDNAVYQFASTAPGTYQVMDAGRFVRSFEAVDASGTVVPAEQISTNQWRISDPEDVVEIRYEVAETWDTPVEEHPIYLMAGTSIEDDHALFNNQLVFGYPTGMQTRPARVHIDRPSDWVVGTALVADDTGYYLAESYDHLVDSPILTGDLSAASVDVNGADVDIFTYSKTGAVESEEIMEAVRSILEAAGEYLGELPVNRYAFLFHFEDVTMGALEHSYSSTYVFAESAFDQMIAETIPDIVAHEFLHIVTPLNIHSEVIEQFNFVTPSPSEHVWLYEGVTEWMSHASQLHAGLIDVETYLARLSEKLEANDRYDPNFSLSDISLKSYSQKGQQEWGNIYQRGAVVAALLDLKLLELSGGERGLRDVILELSEKYGPDTAFDEETFFDELTRMTYPEVRSFVDDYIRGTEPLPIEESFAAIGVDYVPERDTGEKVPSFGVRLGVSGEDLVIQSVESAAAECGLRSQDVLAAIDGQDVSLPTAQQAIARLQALGAGEPFVVTVRRDEDEQSFECAKKLIPRLEHHVLNLSPDATSEQLALRAAWAGGAS